MWLTGWRLSQLSRNWQTIAVCAPAWLTRQNERLTQRLTQRLTRQNDRLPQRMTRPSGWHSNWQRRDEGMTQRPVGLSQGRHLPRHSERKSPKLRLSWRCFEWRFAGVTLPPPPPAQHRDARTLRLILWRDRHCSMVTVPFGKCCERPFERRGTVS